MFEQTRETIRVLRARGLDLANMTWWGRLLVEVASGLRRIEIFDRSMTLAAQTFTSFIPLVIVLASLVAPEDTGAAVGQVLALPDSTRAAVEGALPSGNDARAFGILGALVVLLLATSLSRALGRMYAKVWHTTPAGLRGGWRWLLILVGVMVAAMGVRMVRDVDVSGVWDLPIDTLLTLVVNLVVWTWIPWLLLEARIHVVLLLPGGLLMGVASVLVSWGTAVWLPIAMRVAAAQYGPLGVAFTYISWFFVVSFALVATTVVGQVAVTQGWPVFERVGATKPVGARSSTAG
jgi:membrane protein